MTKPDFSDIQDPDLRAKLEKVAQAHQDDHREIKTTPIDVDYVFESYTPVPGVEGEYMATVVNKFGQRRQLRGLKLLENGSALIEIHEGEQILAWPTDKAWESNVVNDGQEKGENA